MAFEASTVALVAAGFWSMSMVLSKRGLSEGGTSLQVTVVVTGIAVLVYWPFLFVQYGTGLFDAFTPVGVGVFVAAGLVGTALGRLSSFAAINRVGASVNNAAVSARPLFATALAFLWLGEAIGLQVGVGIVVLVIGLVVLSLSRGGDIEGWQSWELLFSLGAAGAWAFADVIRRFALTTTPATALHGVAVNETAGFVALAAFLVARHPEQLFVPPKRASWAFIGSGAFNACSLLLFFVALEIGPVAIATSLVGVSALYTAVFAYFLLGDLERITRGIVVGAVLVVIGAAMITLA